MKFLKDILCKIGIHDWIESDDFDDKYTQSSKVCKNCYYKVYIRRKSKLKRKNGASKKDIRDIKLKKLLK